MQTGVEEFFHTFRQEVLAGAAASQDFELHQFMENIGAELIETGVLEGFEPCHYRHLGRTAIRVDGFWFNDDGVLNLLIADFDSRNELLSLTKTEVMTLFKRLGNFFNACVTAQLFTELDETTAEYGLARQIADRNHSIRKLNFLLLSERTLSNRVKSLDDAVICDIPVSYHIWDIARLHRQASSSGHKEALDIDLVELCGSGIACLPAHIGGDAFESYLIVMPGNVLFTIYEKYDAALLEQNVRCFLQARGKVNKGIRSTIINEPDMFFAYNNGITATAKGVEIRKTNSGVEIININDLQIVNGGQTTASLFHTSRKDKAELDKVFVQMKLSIVDNEKAEEFVPKISEYANTQNRVNAADFFSNHPFHIRMQDFSRRIWAPAQAGEQRETKWFYERARGQYADALNKLVGKEQKHFKVTNPKPQMFTKTDLAKYENVWDEHPKWVNLGAQKNFAQYAGRVAKKWKDSPDEFNEFYFKRAIARAIIFRATEKLVSSQPWYNGGYRANIVAYALALMGESGKQRGTVIDYLAVWKNQAISDALRHGLVIVTAFVNERLIKPPAGISNISEWAKKEACWTQLKDAVAELEPVWPQGFIAEQIPCNDIDNIKTDAKKLQKVDNGINAQKEVIELGAAYWKELSQKGIAKGLLSEREMKVLGIAVLMPAKVPTVPQAKLLLEVSNKVK